MDFNAQVIGKAGLVGVAADALLVVVRGTAVPADLEAALAAPLQAAVADGDFAFKAGKILYAHRVEGVKARRVIFAWAADGSAKSLRKAVVAGAALVKDGGARHLAMAVRAGRARRRTC